jgi:hypothetical protein
LWKLGIPATFRFSSLTKALWLVFIRPPAKLPKTIKIQSGPLRELPRLRPFLS